MTKLFFIGFLLLTGSVCGQSYSSFEVLKKEIVQGDIPLISAEDLHKITSKTKNIVILDARESEEYQVSHIAGAIAVGYDKFNFKMVDSLDRMSPVVVYCSVGYRSEKVAKKLKKKGFKKVLNLEGGIFDWNNKGFPLEDSSGLSTSKIHGYAPSWGKWLTKGEIVYE